MKKLLVTILLGSILITTGYSQVLDPVNWNFSSQKIDGNTFLLSFESTIEKGWHMYGMNIPDGGPVATSFIFTNTEGGEFSGEISSGRTPEIEYDETFEMDLELFDGKISFSRKIKITSSEPVTITGFVEYMVCDDSRCLPPKEVEFAFTLTPDRKEKASIQSKPREIIEDIEPESPAKFEKVEISIDQSSVAETDTNLLKTTSENQPEEEEEQSLLALFLIAFAAGFGALLTPCVYPIIPLTISFFMRDTTRSKAIFNGLFFGFSIIFIYTMVGLIAGLTKVDIARLVSSHWLPNILFFLIFLALAFSFFGMFEITLPGSLSNKIDQQADKGGFMGPFFMALATVVISFSCTGPIVGVVLGSALQGELVKPVIGMLGFSISFALPFTLLAIFPEFMKKMPKSGGWLNSVKVVFAFILLASSLIFITNLRLDFVSRDLVLSILLVIFVMLGLYLLGKLKFSHDSELPFLSVTRLMLSIASFVFALWLFTGLMGAPLNLIAPFIPEGKTIVLTSDNQTSTHNSKTLNTGNSSICTDSPKFGDILHMPLGLQGYFDYDEALACAQELDKPVLLDFAGHSCKNCKKMYNEVWTDPRVLSSLQNDFIISALYTDDRTKLPESEWVTSTLDGKVKKTMGKKFNDLQITKFGSNALPLYAIVDPDGNILTSADYYTYSSDIDGFLEFLEEGKSNFSN